jgi:hypothetical protein
MLYIVYHLTSSMFFDIVEQLWIHDPRLVLYQFCAYCMLSVESQ